MSGSLETANRLRPVLFLLGRALRREADDLGITGGQAALLGTVLAHPELGVGELAAQEGVSAAALSRYLDRLEAAGWLTRERDARDRRRVRPVVTPAGKKVVQAVRSRRTAWLAERLDVLSAADGDAIRAAIDPLSRLLEDDD